MVSGLGPEAIHEMLCTSATCMYVCILTYIYIYISYIYFVLISPPPTHAAYTYVFVVYIHITSKLVRAIRMYVCMYHTCCVLIEPPMPIHYVLAAVFASCFYVLKSLLHE
jgi:hypothetical protein